MAIPTIDPAKPDAIAALAGYLGEHSVINARIKGGRKAVAKVYIYVDPYSPRYGEPIEASKWTYKEATDPRSVVGLFWSYPSDDLDADKPAPAHWIKYLGGEVVHEVDESGQGSSYDAGRDAWWSWDRGPVWLEDRAFGRVDPEALDLDWSDVSRFMKSKGVSP